MEAAIRLIGTDRAVGEVVNIGGTEEITIRNLAELVKERASSSSPIISVPYDRAYEPGFEDMLRRVPSIEKLERLTNFRPAIPLARSVDRVIDAMRVRNATEPSSRAAATEMSLPV